MNALRLALSASVLLLGMPATSPADGPAERVDALLARWKKPGSPGCALGVVRDGKLSAETFVGLADVEQGRPIGPDTVFHVASVSKQFTAMAVLLLEREGKLSLEDDVREHLPELHDFGRPITLRHLLQHTSGLRDQWDLASLAGWRMSDVITDEDVFRLACRQRELNFEPGDRYLYCNTGFTLAARVVERASGLPFREFARRRIFEPLGMAHTRFPADHQEIIPGRARSYHPAAEGRYVNAILSYGTAGATSLHTTVADLARWDANFDDPRVGDAALLARLQEVGTRNDGGRIGYALGLQVGEYRGLKVVEHGGSDAGFRSAFVRFPTERLSVIILANASDFAPGDLARRVADAYLGKEPVPPRPRPAGEAPAEVPVSPELFDAYVGEYRDGPGQVVVVAREDVRLTARPPGGDKVSLSAAGAREFFAPGGGLALTFDEPVGGRSPALKARIGGRRLTATRTPAGEATADRQEGCLGDYYSRELGVVYTVFRRGDGLMIRHPRVELPLRPVSVDVYEAPGPLGRVTFDRREGGRAAGLAVDKGRSLRVRFDRVELGGRP